MSTAWTLGVALVTSVVGAAAMVLVLSPEPPPAQPVDASGGSDPRLDELARGQAELAQAIEELRQQLDAGAPRHSVTPADSADLEQKVAQMIRDELARQHSSDAPLLDLAQVMRDLLNPSIAGEPKAMLWEELRANGQIDAVVEQFEQLAAASPGDSMRQTELAWAYQHRMLAADNGPERGKWGGKAAATLERALELDETNWDARYSLAQHSYWAEMKGDAVRHFETLLEQQRHRAPEPKHAQAYAWLGNIHMDRGDKTEALRIWNQGLALFPGDKTLQGRVDAFR